MNASIQRKLERLAERHTEITALLAEPEVQGDQARFRALGPAPPLASGIDR